MDADADAPYEACRQPGKPNINSLTAGILHSYFKKSCKGNYMVVQLNFALEIEVFYMLFERSLSFF